MKIIIYFYIIISVSVAKLISDRNSVHLFAMLFTCEYQTGTHKMNTDQGHSTPVHTYIPEKIPYL